MGIQCLFSTNDCSCDLAEIDGRKFELSRIRVGLVASRARAHNLFRVAAPVRTSPRAPDHSQLSAFLSPAEETIATIAFKP